MPASGEPSLPRITIGTSAYNAAATLPLTLRSIFAQTVTDWELILVDDGSTDGSADIMRAIDDDRVRLFAHADNKTASPRLNEISRAARAPLIARIDADDVMDPRRLEEQLAYLDYHPEVDVVGTGMYSIDKGYRIQGKRGRFRPPSSQQEVATRGLLVHSTVLGKTQWFLENPYDESPYARRCEDAELWLRTFGRSTFGAIDEPLQFCLEDPGQALRKLRSSNLGRIRIMFQGRSEIRGMALRSRLRVAATICLKMAFYELFWALGRGRYLIERRNLPLDAGEAGAAAATLEQIRRLPLPGIGRAPA